MTYSYLNEPDPWLYSYTRRIVAVLSALGGLLTAYLTLSKLTEQKVAFCTNNAGCDLVLSSKWAWFLGMPTAALGFLGFTAVFLLAVLPDGIPFLKRWRWPGLFATTTSMAAFEVYMLYLMVGVLKQFCMYCTAAILLVAGLWLVTLLGRRWIDWGQLAFSGTIIALATLVFTVGVYATQTPPPSPLAKGLALHLQQTGGTMYGAYWCPHCAEQKELFGSAFKDVPYVECSPNGPGTPQAQECIDKGVESYPTWFIGDKVYRGVQSLEKLSAASGFQGAP
ncbi:MAG: vitamin K epoxide reductase family protein [Cyanobacteriota bacterium]|nr:vitamin K epoxide reductase family protein [Cyanobacteriota bacterium]